MALRPFGIVSFGIVSEYRVCVRVRVRACVRACVRARARAYVRACVRARARARVCARTRACACVCVRVNIFMQIKVALTFSAHARYFIQGFIRFSLSFRHIEFWLWYNDEDWLWICQCCVTCGIF